MLRFILLLCLICAHRSDAAVPAIISSTMELQDVEEGGNQYEVVDIKIDFDQDLYLKLHNGTKIPIQNLLGQKKVSDYNKVPKSIYYGRGSVELDCQETILPADDLFSGGPRPDKIYVGTSTAEPVSSFILSFSGVVINETFVKNRVSVLRIAPKGTFDQDFLKQCKLSFKQSTSSDGQAIFTNSNDEPVPSAVIEFTRIEPRTCDFNKFKAFRKTWRDVLDNALSNSKNEDALNTMEMTFMAVLSRGGYTNCFNLLKSFLTMGERDLTLSGFRDCPHAWNETDPDWLADPCCNWKLSETTCCMAKPVTIKVPKLVGTKQDVISNACSNVNKVNPIITDYIDTQRKQQLIGKENPNDYWGKFYRFISDCNTKVFEQSCSSDAQCPFTGECDNQRGKCFVSYNGVAEALAKCYVAEMDPDLRAEFKSVFKMKAIYASAEDENVAFYNLFTNKTTSEDCVGPTSDNYRSERDWIENDEGEWEEVVTPGNATACVSDKHCNIYPYWEVLMEERGSTCPSGAPSNVCMDCRGDFCEPVSKQPECYKWGVSDSDCTAAGGTKVKGKCVYPNNTKETCLTNQWCRNAEHWQQECSYSSCIVSNITTKTACDDWRLTQENKGNYQWFWWNNDASSCQTYSSKSSCEASGYYYWPGKRYTPGKWHTEALCNEGLCTNPEMRWQDEPPTAAECKSSQYCSTPCKGCESKGSNSQVCLNTTVTTKTDCDSWDGTWQAGSGGTAGACSKDNYNYDKSSCEAAGLTHFTCSGTKSTCDSSAAQSVLECYWSSFKQCTDQSDCESGGFCTDWELANDCEWNQCSETGVCIKPFDSDRSCNGTINEAWSQVGCVIQTTEANCISLGYEWVVRARNKSECISSVTACKDPDMGGWFSLKNATECTKCDGTMKPVYNWIEPQWNNGTIRNLTWTTVAQKTVNRWTRTFDHGKFGTILDGIISRIVARKQFNAFSKKYNPLVLLLDRVACDCGTNGESTCFDSIESVVLETCRVDPGSAEQSCGGLTIDTSSQANSTNATSTSVQIDEIPASQLAGGSGSASRGAKSIGIKADASTYAVVKMGSETVGQLVGNGKGFSCTDGNCDGATFYACFDKNPSIPQDTSTYPVLDIAPAAGNSVGEPMKTTVTEKNGGLQYCASLASSGTYYPILRKESLPASGGSASATASATATATSTPGTEPDNAAPGRAMGQPASWVAYASIIVAIFLA